jgi:hypothetical protein
MPIRRIGFDFKDELPRNFLDFVTPFSKEPNMAQGKRACMISLPLYASSQDAGSEELLRRGIDQENREHGNQGASHQQIVFVLVLPIHGA